MAFAANDYISHLLTSWILKQGIKYDQTLSLQNTVVSATLYRSTSRTLRNKPKIHKTIHRKRERPIKILGNEYSYPKCRASPTYSKRAFPSFCRSKTLPDPVSKLAQPSSPLWRHAGRQKQGIFIRHSTQCVRRTVLSNVCDSCSSYHVSFSTTSGSNVTISLINWVRNINKQPQLEHMFRPPAKKVWKSQLHLGHVSLIARHDLKQFWFSSIQNEQTSELGLGNVSALDRSF